MKALLLIQILLYSLVSSSNEPSLDKCALNIKNNTIYLTNSIGENTKALKIFDGNCLKIAPIVLRVVHVDNERPDKNAEAIVIDYKNP